MITSLIEGTRAIRVQLVAGYSALLTGYIGLHDRLVSREEWTGGAAILGDLYSSFGAAGRAAFWTFVAFLLGSVISNLFFNALVEWAARFPKAPPWTEFIKEARDELRLYEEYVVVSQTNRDGQSGMSGFRTGDTSHRVPSHHHAEFLSDEVKDRERRFAEVQFRMALALGFVVPVAVLAVRAGAGWLLCLLPSLLIWLDMGRLQDRTRRYMKQATRKAMLERLEGLHREVERHQKSVAELERSNPKQTDYDERIQRGRARTAELDAQIADQVQALAWLEAQPDQIFAVRARRSP